MTLANSKLPPQRRLDVSGLMLLLIGLLSLATALWAVQSFSLTPLLIAPAIITSTLGASHLTKWESPRQ